MFFLMIVGYTKVNLYCSLHYGYVDERRSFPIRTCLQSSINYFVAAKNAFANLSVVADLSAFVLSNLPPNF